MKETFQLLSQYNAVTNVELMQILAEVPEQDLGRNVGSYFGSILGIMNHILRSDVVWLRRFSDNLPELAAVGDDLPHAEAAGLTDILWPDLDTLAPVREGVDGLITRVVEALPEQDYTSVLHYASSKGRQEKVVWRAFLHVFNHQTHHRGQVSVLLDQLSVKNDYSNLIWRF